MDYLFKRLWLHLRSLFKSDQYVWNNGICRKNNIRWVLLDPEVSGEHMGEIMGIAGTERHWFCTTPWRSK